MCKTYTNDVKLQRKNFYANFGPGYLPSQVFDIQGNIRQNLHPRHVANFWPNIQC